MSKIHRSARGDAIDMDMIRLANESTIAIGNMKTNARGDEGHRRAHLTRSDYRGAR